ncbi:MAG: DDE-type integrase/transposase/recombinase, partial [Pseudomonadota bacterium]
SVYFQHCACCYNTSITPNGRIVEDASWLRKKNDANHINLAELEAVLKGVNMAANWEISNLKIIVDSATVFGWLRSTFEDTDRVKMHGMSEILVKRRLCLLKEIRDEVFDSISIELVPSQKNKADALTRVDKKWMTKSQTSLVSTGTPDVKNSQDELRIIHNECHFGVERTFYLAKCIYPQITKDEVVEIVKSCQVCSSIDPTPIKYNHGTLEVDRCWDRLAVDVTHYKNESFLTIIDCGPSRFAIWRKILSENRQFIIKNISQIFREFGPPKKLLLDNSTVFTSKDFKDLCSKWKVNLNYRCAYRPEGNGIVERNHRTIKRMSARTQQDPEEMVYWYNNTPKHDQEVTTIPSRQMFSYEIPVLIALEMKPLISKDEEAKFGVGDVVFVKPPNSRCTTKWPTGVVTEVLSKEKFVVNGVPRHVSHLRLDKRKAEDNNSCAEDQREETVDERRPFCCAS